MTLEYEAMLRGERPVILDDQGKQNKVDALVSCLSAKYHTKGNDIIDQNGNELSWHLPGWGKSKDDCGDYLKAISCPDHDIPTVTGEKHTRGIILKHCFNPECPICYPSWAIREGNAAADRMKASERLYRGEDLDLQDARHFTFSPPQDAAVELIKTKMGYKRLKGYAVKLIKKAGLKGGVIIFHSHRVNKFKQLYLSPHFHVVAYGYIMDSPAFEKMSKGWIYKNMGKRSTLAGTLIYALDHCGLSYEKDNPKRIFHALTWFGLLSYNQVGKREVFVEEKTVPCKACENELLEYALTVNPGGHGMSPDWLMIKGVHLVKIKTVIYKLVKYTLKRRKSEAIKETEFKRFERVP
jgi:hypothetical protein